MTAVSGDGTLVAAVFIRGAEPAVGGAFIVLYKNAAENGPEQRFASRVFL